MQKSEQQKEAFMQKLPQKEQIGAQILKIG
jgi:hypothetical protein